MIDLVLLANFVATAVMTGVIWFVQWVHYPLLATVPVDRAVETAVVHQHRTGQVLALPMAVEGVTTLWFGIHGRILSIPLDFKSFQSGVRKLRP